MGRADLIRLFGKAEMESEWWWAQGRRKKKGLKGFHQVEGSHLGKWRAKSVTSFVSLGISGGCGGG